MTGTLQAPTAHQGLQAQAVLYDKTGHVTGLDSQLLTRAEGLTPVRIIFRESFTYSGFPNPWGPVARAAISAYDDIQPLLANGAVGQCQQLPGPAPALSS